MIRIWLALMGALTAVTTAPYVFDTAKTASTHDGLTLTGPQAAGSVIIAYGMQGIAVGLYCIWGAAVPARAREAMRFLVLYMVCVVVGRVIAAAPFFGQPTSMPMIALAADTAITIFSAALLWRGRSAPELKAASATA
jgi:hypothetical protein